MTKIRNVITLDDDDSEEIHGDGHSSALVPTRSSWESTSDKLSASNDSVLSPNALLVAVMDLQRRKDLDGLKSFLSWNSGGRFSFDLDAQTLPHGAKRAGTQSRKVSLARTPSPITKTTPRSWLQPKVELPDESKASPKRARDSVDLSPAKRTRPSPISDVPSHTNLKERSTTVPMACTPYFHAPTVPHRQPTKEEIQHTFVELMGDSSEDEVMETSSDIWNDVKKHKIRRRLEADDIVFDLDEVDDDLYEEMAESIGGLAITNQLKRRNKPVEYPWEVCETALTSSGTILKPGQLLELTDMNFLHVVLILKNAITGAIMLRGHSLSRTSNVNGVLPRKLNELVWQMEIELDDERPFHQQSMAELPLLAVRCPRDLRITNHLFPTGSYRDTGGFYDMITAKSSAPCTMRWRWTSIFLNRGDREKNKWHEKCLEHIKGGEIPNGPAHLVADDMKVRFNFRGPTTLGGAYGALQPLQGEPTTLSSPSMEVSDQILIVDGEIPSAAKTRHRLSSLETVDLTTDDEAEQKSVGIIVNSSTDLTGSGSLMPLTCGQFPSSSVMESKLATQSMIVRGSGQKYTYGDAFCGAGGATRGATMAGLKVVWGFDINEHACSSWRLNFPTANVYEMSAHDFFTLSKGNDARKVDILHLSPPCQFFSPAHTVPGKDDELNTASLFACGDILGVVRPRIATLEQTFGITVFPKFRQYFNALVLLFTSKGYSIRWKVACLQDWGLPQRRRRLIMIASCPGEPLPEFPPFTHCDPNTRQPGRRPWNSVNAVLGSIPINAPDHDLAGAFDKPLGRDSWDGDSIAPRCITTHGGHNYHPSGERGLTNREFAALQGFPHNHLFSQYNVKKQVGNAVPPSIAKVLFEWIRKWLEKVDRVKPDHFQLD